MEGFAGAFGATIVYPIDLGMSLWMLFNCHVTKVASLLQSRYVVLSLNGTLTETPAFGSADEVRFYGCLIRFQIHSLFLLLECKINVALLSANFCIKTAWIASERCYIMKALSDFIVVLGHNSL